MWKIGNVEIKNRVCLAPMAGVSDPAYMKICKEMGCGYAVTELISSEAVVRDNKKTFAMLNGINELEMPVAVQIFGSDPYVMANAAKILYNTYKFHVLDINVGCPVPKVSIKSKSGSALLKDLNKLYKIVSAVVESIPIPVTVKIRSGWDSYNINAVEVAKTCESAGASAICIHPRTRAQGYSGHSDWSIIKSIKDSVSIPVIGNGDIKNIYDAKKMIDETGCDAIMIGRASLGNPWIFKQILEYLNEEKIISTPDFSEKIEMCIKHLNNLLAYKSERFALLEIRNHVSWYLKGISGANEIKNAIFLSNSVDEVIEILNNYKNKMEDFK